MIHCLYCDEWGPQAREHVLPLWLSSELETEGLLGTPALDKHLFRGNQTLPNVCFGCNNGSLRNLDEIARDWWQRRGSSRDPVLDASPPLIGRWVAKIAVNLDAAEGMRPRLNVWMPTIPQTVKSWVLGLREVPPEAALLAAALPAEHHFARDFGTYHSDNRRIGAYTLQLLGILFFLVWSHPLDPVAMPLPELLGYYREYHPAVRLDLVGGVAPVQLPIVPKPDELNLGIYDDPQLAARYVERLTAIEKVGR